MATDMESILTLREARGLRGRMLEWHYRSRDPSLIRVSNAEFYESNLVLPPSPLQLDPNYGLKFRRVNGAYSSKGKGTGRASTNKIEAQEIVAEMARHAREWPELSLGVVTFSKSQSDMVTQVLEHARRQDTTLDAFLREGNQEDVFVKNIENVQGDERDVILISVGYGPHEPGGRLASQNFGPVNGEGGERRLNVLFSRARVRCEVFASFDPGDIDPSRSVRVGPRVLKRFLDFAKTKIMDERMPTGLGADSPLEEDIAHEIRRLGYPVDPQVGSGGFRIDLGVLHPDRPGQYILAVECDGASYHSALWARERDRLRQEVLENLAWRFHRIWSTDWFHHRRQELERLKAALEVARAAAEGGIRVTGANAGRKLNVLPEPNPAPPAIKPPDIREIRITVPPYTRAQLPVHSRVEPHEAPLNQFADLVRQIVEIEGPILNEEVARRVSAAFGKARTGRRIIKATQRALSAAVHTSQGQMKRDGSFWMTAAQAENPPVRDRSAETGPTVKADALPPFEIRACAKLLASESGAMEPDEMVRAVARTLGFQRVGQDLAAAIQSALDV
jgi:very-short-patch-repair endonuclease